jgi:multisubunit Na+/H+ antiporter MnhE subunit
MAMRRLSAAAILLTRFVVQVVVSGIATAWMIVRPGARPVPGLLRMRFHDLDPVGAALLGCIISLTPGTTTIDVDVERGELLLHLLDASDPSKTVATIRAQFERSMQVLFPARRGS